MFVDQKAGYRALREIVLERPKHVDPYAAAAWADEDDETQCVYAERREDQLVPVCLVGQWVARVGGDLAALEMNSQSAIHAIETAGLETTDVLVGLLDAAQNCQDRALPWGEALDTGLAVVKGALVIRKAEPEVSWSAAVSKAALELATRTLKAGVL